MIAHGVICSMSHSGNVWDNAAQAFAQRLRRLSAACGKDRMNPHEASPPAKGNLNSRTSFRECRSCLGTGIRIAVIRRQNITPQTRWLPASAAPEGDCPEPGSPRFVRYFLKLRDEPLCLGSAYLFRAACDKESFQSAVQQTAGFHAPKPAAILQRYHRSCASSAIRDPYSRRK